MKYPIAYQTWGEAEIDAAVECLREGQTTMWARTARFEREFAKYLGTTEAVMVNSGSSADFVMMLAAVHLGMLKPGDEVLLPAVTWPTQAWACILAGLKVRFVDIDPLTLQMNPDLIEITPKTKALFVTHLMGVPNRMDRIEDLAAKHGLLIFEDCCEALGASFAGQKAGTFGVASAFSFFHSHHISTMEGGMIASSDATFTDTCRMIRAHGWVRDLKHPPYVKGDRRFHFVGPGLNFRPTELNAAFGLHQLPKLDMMNSARNANAAALHLALNDYFQWTRVASYFDGEPAWFAFPLVLKDGKDRADLMAYLESSGVESRPIAGGNLVRQPAFAHLRDCGGPFPNADLVHDGGLYIGLPPVLTDMTEVVEILRTQVPA